jgi:hypothetical protein
MPCGVLKMGTYRYQFGLFLTLRHFAERESNTKSKIPNNSALLK